MCGTNREEVMRLILAVALVALVAHGAWGQAGSGGSLSSACELLPPVTAERIITCAPIATATRMEPYTLRYVTCDGQASTNYSQFEYSPVFKFCTEHRKPFDNLPACENEFNRLPKDIDGFGPVIVACYPTPAKK
jgi:hypothetical protein